MVRSHWEAFVISMAAFRKEVFKFMESENGEQLYNTYHSAEARPAPWDVQIGVGCLVNCLSQGFLIPGEPLNGEHLLKL